MGSSKEIFISYRRDTGSELAEIIKKDLDARGYSVFKDTHDLKAGHWQEALTKQINACKDFVLLVTPGALDRCKTDPNDVVLFEIRLALATRKNFILVVKRAKDQSPNDYFKDLPLAIADLPKHNWVEYTNDDSDAKLQKIRSFLNSSPSVWELVNNRYGKQILASAICVGLLVCGLLGWGIFGRTVKIEKTIEVISVDTKEIVNQTSEIRKDNASLMNEASEVRKDTGEIKAGIKNIGNLGGLVANPLLAEDYYHNSHVYLKDGKVVEADDSFKRFFDLDKSDYYDVYEEYIEFLRGAYGQEKVLSILKSLTMKYYDRKSPKVAYFGELEDKEFAKQEIDKILLKSPSFLPAHIAGMVLVEAGYLIDDLDLENRKKNFLKEGGLDGLKKFLFKTGDNKFEQSVVRFLKSIRPVNLENRFSYKVENDSYISLLYLSVADRKLPKNIILHFPNGDAKIPVDSPANLFKEKGFVAVELNKFTKPNTDAKTEFILRRANDVRIFKFSGYLNGVDPSKPVEVAISYIDAKNRNFDFPKKIKMFGSESLFTAEIMRSSSTNGIFGSKGPVLQITPGTTTKLIQASGKKSGPFIGVPMHMNVPTLYEVPCEAVPNFNFDGELWIKSILDNGSLTDIVKVEFKNEFGVVWKSKPLVNPK